jgi:aminoglycoside phosphotransferase (APT) family kinase protein
MSGSATGVASGGGGGSPIADPVETERTLTGFLPKWLSERIGRPVAAVNVRRLTGGWSAENWLVQIEDDKSSSSTPYVLKWIPPGGLSTTAGGLRFQADVMAAVRQHGVPAPTVRWIEESGDTALGHPFIVMDQLPGTPAPRYVSLRDAAQRKALDSYLETLTRIHAIPSLGDDLDARMGRPTERECSGFAIAEVEQHLADQDVPAVFVEAMDWLRSNRPAASEVTLIHGDANFSNYLFENGRVAAVLDWEHAMLLDPTRDLAQVCLGIQRFSPDTPEDRLTMCGIFVNRYRELSGRELPDLRFWELLFTVRAAATFLHKEFSSMGSPLYAQRARELLDGRRPLPV